MELTGLENVLERLEQLNSTSSVNKKIELLETFLNDSTFRKVVKYTLDPTRIYHVKKLPEYPKENRFISPKHTEGLFKKLKQLSNQTGASNKDKYELLSYIWSDKEYELLSRIVKKDLRCGVSAALVNRARPGTILVIPYQRCTTDISKLKYPCFSQLKANGMFVNLIIRLIKGQVKISFITRAGQKVRQMKKLKKIIYRGVTTEIRFRDPETRTITREYEPKKLYMNQVFMGEMLVRKKGKILDRQTGNGVLNSCIQKTADLKGLEIILRLWDNVPYEKWVEGKFESNYRSRWFHTTSFCNVGFMQNDVIEPIECFVVDDHDELRQHYDIVRERGEEGTIGKNFDGIWEDTKSGSNDQVKVKNETEIELIILDVQKGKKGTKYEKCLGALLCGSADGKVEVSVGSGFSDKKRGYFPIRNEKGGVIGIDEEKAKKALKYWKKKKGSIVSVICEGLVSDKRKDTFSLYLPRFDEERFDRSDADTLEMIKARIKGK